MSTSAAVWVPILVAIVTALATVITVYLTGRANLRLEREKFDSNSKLERQKFESSLILQVIETGLSENAIALNNLKFLVKMGFLPHLKGAIDELDPEDTGVLPASVAVEPPPPGARPPEYRWPVRTGSDRDASLVNDKPVPTTVEELVEQPRPDDMQPATRRFPAYQNHRAAGVERTIHVLEATIVSSKLMISQNFHLILQGDSGQTMIGSCPHPDPAFVDPTSRWAKQIAVVRNQIEKRLAPEPTKRKLVNERVRITGIGFFNDVHGQVGVAPNGIELTPVLGIEWLDNSVAPVARSSEQVK
jgi:hypothetical protein